VGKLGVVEEENVKVKEKLAKLITVF